MKLGIRGRGNSSWVNFDKKPYKLKFAKKQKLLGMPANKHFALLPFVGAFSAYFAHPLGMEIGRYIMKGWTPHMTPVEVVLNGQYIGLYVLTETVRIDKGRIEIAEQSEDNRDPELIDGGYLVEIDNYTREENQIKLMEAPATPLLISVDTPGTMNAVHKKYLTKQFGDINKAIYCEDKLSRDWEELVDAESYARHFIVQEIMNNHDAYNGSVKMTKESGKPWSFGPLWDTGDSFDLIKEDFTFNATIYRKTWIPQTYRFPRFVKLVQRIWREFREIDDSVWTDFLIAWNDAIKQAEDQNQKVWKYNRGHDTTERMYYTHRRLMQHIEWLDKAWGSGDLTHNVSVRINGDGTAAIGVHDFPDVDVFDGDGVVISLKPARGMCLHSLTVNGEDRLEVVKKGKLALCDITEDINVGVEFVRSYSIEKNVVCAYVPVEVYNISGTLIGKGTSIRLPKSGVYIIKVGGTTDKIIL